MADKSSMSDFEDSTENIIVRSLTSLAEGLTGLLTSDRKDLTLSIGHLLQRMRGGRILYAFNQEWKKFREKGRIVDSYETTDQHLNCLHELLDFLDKDIPDEVRISVLKRILIVAASEKFSTRESLLPHQYMQICRRLTSGEMLVLLTVFRIAKEETWDKDTHYGARRWLQDVSEESGLQHLELVELHEEGLIRKNLLTERLHPDRSGIHMDENFRLTGLGFEICQFISNYDELDT